MVLIDCLSQLLLDLGSLSLSPYRDPKQCCYTELVKSLTSAFLTFQSGDGLFIVSLVGGCSNGCNTDRMNLEL